MAFLLGVHAGLACYDAAQPQQSAHHGAAVAAAYGWADYSPQMSDDDILARLLALNLARTQPPVATLAA